MKKEMGKAVKSKSKKEDHKINLYELEKKLVENMVELQKVHTHLAGKFDRLSIQISDLLNLFEMAAKSFMEQPAIKETEKDKEFLDKIDRLLEQNKVIARGLTLMEERIREKMYGSPHPGMQHNVHHAVHHKMHQQPQPVQNKEEKKEDFSSSSSMSRPLPKV